MYLAEQGRSCRDPGGSQVRPASAVASSANSVDNSQNNPLIQAEAGVSEREAIQRSLSSIFAENNKQKLCLTVKKYNNMYGLSMFIHFALASANTHGIRQKV